MTTTQTRASRPGILRHHPVLLFVALALAMTWAVWVPRALALSYGWSGGATATLLELAPLSTYGPAIAAVVAAALTRGRRGVRELGARLVRWRVPVRYYAVVLVGPAAMWLVVTGMYLAVGGDAADATPQAVRVGLAGALPMLLMLCVTDGLGEETGWRGFALPHLLARTDPVRASILLGLIWALWHLPLYWTEGLPLHRSPILLLFIDLPITAILYTWVYRRTGSALLAVLLHGTANLFAVPIPSDGEGELVPFLLAMLVRALLAVAAVRSLRGT